MAEPNNTPIPASTPRSGSPTPHQRSPLHGGGHGFSLSQSHFSPLSPSRFAAHDLDAVDHHLPPHPSSSTSFPSSAPDITVASPQTSVIPTSTPRRSHLRILLFGESEQQQQQQESEGEGKGVQQQQDGGVHKTQKSYDALSGVTNEHEFIHVDAKTDRDAVLKGLRNGRWGHVMAIWDATATSTPTDAEAMKGFIWDEDLVEALPREVKVFCGGNAGMVDLPALKERGIQFLEIKSEDRVEEISRLLGNMALMEKRTKKNSTDWGYGPIDGDHE